MHVVRAGLPGYRAYGQSARNEEIEIDDEMMVPGLDAVDFYTRRGCMISAGLSHQLQRRGVPLRVHDIWADEDDAAFVRSVARGNETVPTVRIGDTVLVAPSTRAVLAALAEQAPHLLPARDESASWLNRVRRGWRR
jgi:glutaredoxin